MSFHRKATAYTLLAATSLYTIREVLATAALVITLPGSDTFLDSTDTKYNMAAGDWTQFVYLGDDEWGVRNFSSMDKAQRFDAILKKTTSYTHNGGTDDNAVVIFDITGNCTFTLPAPAKYRYGQRVCRVVHRSDDASHTFTLARNAGGNKINGTAADGALTEGQAFDVICNAASDGFELV